MSMMIELKLNEKFGLFERWVPFDVCVRDRAGMYTCTFTHNFTIINRARCRPTGQTKVGGAYAVPEFANSGNFPNGIPSVLGYRASHPNISEKSPSMVQLWLIVRPKPDNGAKCSMSYVTMKGKRETAVKKHQLSA
jgi:hypothetical protein